MLKVLNKKGEVAMIIEDNGKMKILSEELKESFDKINKKDEEKNE